LLTQKNSSCASRCSFSGLRRCASYMPAGASGRSARVVGQSVRGSERDNRPIVGKTLHQCKNRFIGK
jgi:hypothetical protein